MRGGILLALGLFGVVLPCACTSGTRRVSGPAAVASTTIAPPTTPRPVPGLPDHVVAPNGALSLFADFARAGGGKIPLCLVNRTSKEVRLPTEDGDPYIKLEIAVPGGWRRAEPQC